MRLQNKVTIITGSSQGIGRAVALGFAQEGAKIALNYYAGDDQDRREVFQQRAEAALTAVRQAGAEAIMVEADVGRANEVARLFARTRQILGTVDILVNNAGIYPRTPWATLDEETWDQVIEVNLKGAFLCAKAAVPDMIRKNYGKIINVSSVTFLLGTHPDLAPYLSSKAGVIGLTRALARDLGPHNIQVNVITPGAIQTETELELFPKRDELATYLYERQCLKRRGTPEDMVGAFLFLASAESDFITGQTLNVDGGWAMH